MILVSAFAAVLAGLCLAAAGVLQQRAASRRPSDERMSLRLIRSLVTEGTWLAGVGLAVLSYGFQAVALAFGPLILVQPLIVSELLFAVPASVRLRGLRLRRRDWLAMSAVVAGLSLGMVSANPRQGDPIQPIWSWIPALVVVAVLTGGLLIAARVATGPLMASSYALAGAILMGTQSALYAATIARLERSIPETFASWETYALVVVSLAGAFLIQNAFQAGPLAASTPVLDSALPLVAIGLGVGLFGEQIRTSALGLAGASLGVTLLLIGIIGLDTSPVVRKEQQMQREQQERRASAEPRDA